MGYDHAATHGNRADRTQQLHRRDCDRALADAHRNRFPGKPFLFEVTDLPLFGRHHAADFIGQVDPGFLSQAKSGSVFRNAIDA